ncbi:MAG: hypothetical protein ACYSU0_23220 [Planctomycetota bacterium]|jgi:hypothetical protein
MARYAPVLALFAVSCSRPPATPRSQAETVPDSEKVNAAAEQIEVTDTTPPADEKERAPGSRLSQEELMRLVKEVESKALGLDKLPAPQRFNMTAGRLGERELLRVQWYESPYPGYHRVLHLCSDGFVDTWREVPNWAKQACSGGWLSGEQIADIRARIKALDLKPTPPASPLPAALSGSPIHLVFTSRTRDGVIRHDFLGSVPPNVQAIIDFISGEIEAQWRSTPKAKRLERARAMMERRMKPVPPTR